MRKKFSLIALLIIFIILYFVFIHKSSGKIHEYSFTLEDTSLITKILISDNQTQTEISKTDGSWMVNKSFYASQPAIKQLFRIFKNLDISGLVSDTQSDSINRLLKEQGIRLSFWKEHKLIREFWLGNFDEDKNATLMLNDEDLAAYLVIPGLTKNIRKFIETDPVFWRNKLIFSFRPDEISRIELKDYYSINNSFIINKLDHHYHLFDHTNAEITFDENKLMRYLSYYANIHFESIAVVYNSDTQDSILAQKPVYQIKVTGINTQPIELTLFQKMDGQTNSPDLNFLYGALNGRKPVMIISYFQVDPVLKGIGYFK
jgi:hypothetical protein